MNESHGTPEFTLNVTTLMKYRKFSLSDLQELCRDHGLDDSGVRNDLLARLESIKWTPESVPTLPAPQQTVPEPTTSLGPAEASTPTPLPLSDTPTTREEIVRQAEPSEPLPSRRSNRFRTSVGTYNDKVNAGTAVHTRTTYLRRSQNGASTSPTDLGATDNGSMQVEQSTEENIIVRPRANESAAPKASTTEAPEPTKQSRARLSKRPLPAESAEEPSPNLSKRTQLESNSAASLTATPTPAINPRSIFRTTFRQPLTHENYATSRRGRPVPSQSTTGLVVAANDKANLQDSATVQSHDESTSTRRKSARLASSEGFDTSGAAAEETKLAKAKAVVKRELGQLDGAQREPRTTVDIFDVGARMRAREEEEAREREGMGRESASSVAGGLEAQRDAGGQAENVSRTAQATSSPSAITPVQIMNSTEHAVSIPSAIGAEPPSLVNPITVPEQENITPNVQTISTSQLRLSELSKEEYAHARTKALATIKRLTGRDLG